MRALRGPRVGRCPTGRRGTDPGGPGSGSGTALVVTAELLGNGRPSSTVTFRGGSRTRSLPIPGQVTIDGFPSGSQRVDVTYPGQGCEVVGGESRGVDVPPGGRTEVVFTVACFGRLAFRASDDGSISCFSETGIVSPLTRSQGFNEFGGWSPDGEWFVFSSDRTGVEDVHVVRWDGSDLRALTADPTPDEFPRISPDGNTILFQRGATPRLLTVDLDGSGLRALTSGPGDGGREWSPDGSRIAFHSDRRGRFDVYVMNADGSAVVNVTDDQSGDDRGPLWSPSGIYIAYRRRLNGSDFARIMERDGNRPRQVSTGHVQYMAWSPTGDVLAFQARVDENWNVYLAEPDGGVRLLADIPTLFPRGVTWTPDGQWVITAQLDDAGYQLFELRPDGSLRQRFTRGGGRDGSGVPAPGARNTPFAGPPAAGLHGPSARGRPLAYREKCPYS